MLYCHVTSSAICCISVNVASVLRFTKSFQLVGDAQPLAVVARV